MKKTKILFLAVILFLPCGLSAQVNVEAKRKNISDGGFKNKIGIGTAFSSGNSEYVSLSGNWQITGRFNDFSSFLLADGEMKSADKDRIVNKAFLHLRNIYSFTSRVSIEQFNQIEYNELIKLRIRGLSGSGLRADFFTDSAYKNTKLSIGVGLMYEYEEYTDTPPTIKHLVRSTNYISFMQKFGSGNQIDLICYYRPDIAFFKDYRILIDGNIKFSIGKYVKFVAGLDYRRDNLPVRNVKNYDLSISNGLEVSF